MIGTDDTILTVTIVKIILLMLRPGIGLLRAYLLGAGATAMIAVSLLMAYFIRDMVTYTRSQALRLGELLSEPSEADTLADGKTQLVRDVLAQFHFTESRYRSVFESHVNRVLGALSQLGREVTVQSIVAHIEPDRLLDLSYDLPHEEGVGLRTYLTDLPGWMTRYLSDAGEFLLETLRERGWSPPQAA